MCTARTQVIIEYCAYVSKHVEDPNLLGLTQSLLALLGYKKDDIKTWDKMKKHLNKPSRLFQEFCSVDPTAVDANGKAMQARSLAATARVDLDLLSTHAPTTVKMLIRWLKMERIVHNVAQVIEERAPAFSCLLPPSHAFSRLLSPARAQRGAGHRGARDAARSGGRPHL